jgi:hypothetical protein
MQDAFVRVFNQIVDYKDEIMQICEDTLRKRCDPAGLKAHRIKDHHGFSE